MIILPVLKIFFLQSYLTRIFLLIFIGLLLYLIIRGVCK